MEGILRDSGRITQGNFYRGNCIGSEEGINMAGTKEFFFKGSSTLPQIQYNFMQDGLKYYIILLLVSILVVILGYIFQERKFIIVRKTKLNKILLKKRRSFKKKNRPLFTIRTEFNMLFTNGINILHKIIFFIQ